MKVSTKNKKNDQQEWEKQSPINIEAEKYEVAYSYSRQKLKTYYRSNELDIITNEGIYWQLSGELIDSEIRGGPLGGDFELIYINAHWGEKNKEGSEHTIDGKFYNSELQFVHWDKSHYSCYDEATSQPDGVCIISVFLKLGKPNEEIQKIVNCIPRIIHKGEFTTLPIPVDPNNLIPRNRHYWSYRGSQTIPPYLPCVVWVIFDNPIEISPEQLSSFRNLRLHSYNEETCKVVTCQDRIMGNTRPRFALGGRIILRAGRRSKRTSKIFFVSD